MRVMKDSGIAWIGEIPEDWNVKRVKAVLCERNESNNPIQTDRILSLTNDRGVIPYEEKGDVGNKSKEDLTGYKLAYPGDIVLNSMNVFIGSVALSSYFGCVSPVYYMLYPRNKNDSVSFYNYLFQTKELQTKLHGYGNGIMEIRMRIQMSKLNSVQLPVPPSDVQQKIADYLDRKCSQIDAIIARQQEVIEKLKAYKLSVITEAVTKGLNPHAPMKDSGVEWIGEIPEHWEVRKAAFICDRLVVGVVIKPAEYFDDKGTIPFLRGINLKEYSINTDNLVYITDETNKMLSKSIVRSGDILIVRDGNIGVACVVPPFLDGANVVSMIIMTPMKRYNSCYICYFINSSIGKLQFELTKIGSALTHTSVSAVSKLRLAIPPEEEQNKIVEFLDEKCSSIEMFISKKQVIVDNLIAYKKSLIYEVVTGKKEV